MHSASKSTATTISETSINYNEHLSCDESSYYFNAAYTSVSYPGERAPLGRRMELRGESALFLTGHLRFSLTASAVNNLPFILIGLGMPLFLEILACLLLHYYLSPQFARILLCNAQWYH
ncbi:hypothetical protein T10_8177 [Trichinella papuae]|uniref:Uncharacterized protein n=1 Tax=Trichinella papuae TaxID=268474 RepID=A0A0V1M9L1_9BILA|nr:hypothetical protein T10_10439 [Trichinella papuae]KRZ68341.1 hypothetical protein T10_3362 [Trichinella papuae]KRZ68362.1 hypothetical protein T10_8177 [Trichinella papuae]